MPDPGRGAAMSERMPIERRVRPAFGIAAVLVFVVLAPFGLRSLWTYYENLRLDAAIRAVTASESTVARKTVVPHGDAAVADRDYRAAAALVSDFRVGPASTLSGIVNAFQHGQWPADVEAIRPLMATYAVPLSLADAAAALPFDGFEPYTSYSYRTADLFALQALAVHRAIFRDSMGDPDGAVTSLVTAMQVLRAVDYQMQSQAVFRPNAIALILTHSKASRPSLAKLDQSLANVDPDQFLSRWFSAVRRQVVSNGWHWANVNGAQLAWTTVFAVQVPWGAHQANVELEELAKLIEASKNPWPRRIDDLVALPADAVFPRTSSSTAVGNGGRETTSRERLNDYVLAMATETASVNCLRAAVAVEEYRRDHEERVPGSLSELVPSYLAGTPVDPFSGKSLIMKSDAGGYTVYSVGRNRKDDGGADADHLNPWGFGTETPSDVGVRMRYQ